MTTAIINTPQGNRKIYVDESIDEVQDKWFDALHDTRLMKRLSRNKKVLQRQADMRRKRGDNNVLDSDVESYWAF